MTGFKEETEVTVIGGGIFGLSTAYFLAKEGIDVIVVEKDRVAGGASGCNAGAIEKGLGRAEHPIMTGSYNMYHNWNESGELGYDIELNDVTNLICFTDEHVERMKSGLWKKRLELWEKSGLNLVKRDEWKIPEPNIVEDITWGIERSTTMINIFKVCHGLAWAVKRHGTRIFIYTKATDIKVSDGKVREVVTDKGNIKTKFVVNAAGALAPVIGRMVGIDIPIVPAIGQAMVTEPTPPLTNHIRVQYDPPWFNPDKPFITYSKDPRQKLGITTEIDYHSVEGNYIIARCEHIVPLPLKGTKVRTEPETLKYIGEGAIRLVPQISRLHVIRAYGGLRPVCDDGKPILGKMEGVDGFIIATGGWHSGMSLGPMSGKLISELIMEDRTSVPIEEFSFSRFKKTVRDTTYLLTDSARCEAKSY